MSGRVLHLDGETYCELDLKQVGAHVYVQHPSFVVTVMAWAFDDEPVQSVVWPGTQVLPAEIAVHLAAGGKVSAWNAAFELAWLRRYRNVPAEAMDCVMQRSLGAGFPGSLDQAGPALGLAGALLKDSAAKGLMMQMARPRPAMMGLRQRPWHEVDPTKLEALRLYCVQDVVAERACAAKLPALSPFEARVALADAKINEYGLRIDRQAATDLRRTASIALDDLNHECRRLTKKAVSSPGTQTERLLRWLGDAGLMLPNLEKEVVAEALATAAMPPVARRVLEIRQLAAKASLKKFDRMLDCAGPDDRVRGMFQYCGASRTKRWAGRLVQVHNLPRNPGKIDVNAVIAMAATRSVEDIDMFWEPVNAVSTAIRGCFVAETGKMLAMLDFAQIEARVVAWLAGQQDILDAFRQGSDVYTLAARKAGSSIRQLGKVLTLACGYGMGAARFQETARDYGVHLTLDEAEALVMAWRAGNEAIVLFWYGLQKAVEAAIMVPGKEYTAGHGGRIRVRVWRGNLHIRKPNGDTLVYHRPALVDGEVTFWGVDQKTKQWTLQRTYGGKLVENVTQAVARDLLAEAMLRIEHQCRFLPVLHVHDELVYEVDADASRDDTQALVLWMMKVPAWASGLPIDVDVRTGWRYGK